MTMRYVVVMTPQQSADLKDKFNKTQVALAAVQTQVDALVGLVDDLGTTVTEVTTPPPPPPSPSGEAMPVGDLPGWKQTWAEDFLKPCAEGEFVATYPNIAVHYYGTTPVDTSHRGTYQTKNLSVSNSVQRTRIYTDANGVHNVSVWSPKLSGVGKWGDVASGRFAIRWRSDIIPTYKQAWLLWPQSGTWPRDGEIDFPERSLDRPDLLAFMHRQGAVAESQGGLGGADQDRVRVGSFDATKWHTTVIEWEMGKRCTFILDGKVIGTFTDRVPSTPMHWNIQTETILNKTIPIDPKAAGNVEIDWLCYWAKV